MFPKPQHILFIISNILWKKAFYVLNELRELYIFLLYYNIWIDSVKYLLILNPTSYCKLQSEAIADFYLQVLM